ncbi:MAG: ATP-binding protein [Planctomycetota bacterium]
MLAIAVGVPALVCAGLLMHVHGMERDASRLLEETRESALARELLVRVELAALLLAEGGARGLDPRPAETALDQVRAARRVLEEIVHASASHDPSRAEHQRAETESIRSIDGGLAGAELWLTGDRARSRDEVLADLEGTHRSAATLAEETFQESKLAHTDVGWRARASHRYIGGTLTTIAVVAALGLYLVLRFVLRPLQALRAGAERLRFGDLDHRIDVRSRDEIGDLGRAFNAMADEIGRSHADLTEKVESRTRELIRTARLADVGVLAAGVAHEVNNPLASIASCGEGLLRRLAAGTLDPGEEREYLETIVSEAYRTRGITMQLLDLARPGQAARGRVDPAAIFRQAASLTRHLLAERDLRLEVSLPPDLPPVEGDAGELLQVLLNLILNARDASPAGERIGLRARVAGGAQLWEVEDHGGGIAPEDAERLFDPFYTTKAPGAGTGLGLSLAAAIVDRHGGRIEARNGEAGGARFTVRLPALAEEQG